MDQSQVPLRTPIIPVIDIARVCHEANRAYCLAWGDHSQPAWDDAPDWQQQSAVAGVENVLLKEAQPWEQHDAWMQHKLADGWTYGLVKDAEAKTHPCMVPYEQLPREQRMKDFLLRNVVLALSERVKSPLEKV